ncbi:MAG: hypothetical protein WC728_14965 [Elusimicrobiota bacterium]
MKDTTYSDKPSTRLMTVWGRRLRNKQAAVIPVFVGGKWTYQIPRGPQRVMTLRVGPESRGK